MKLFKKTVILFMILGLVTFLNADAKRYEIESGVIKYTISGGGSIMGVTTTMSGEATSVFRNWGAQELYEEKSSTITMGQTEQAHEMNKLDEGKAYVVDFANKVILEYSSEALTSSPNGDLMQQGKDALVKMGGKKIGEEKFMGYDCEIWELKPARLWLYKGIMLKSEASVMGIKYKTAATRIDLDISVSDEQLKLPDFPIKEASTNMMYDGVVEEEDDVGELSPEQMQQLQEAYKNFSQAK